MASAATAIVTGPSFRSKHRVEHLRRQASTELAHNSRDHEEEERIKKMVEAAAASDQLTFLPQQIKHGMVVLAPIIGKLSVWSEIAAPYILEGWRVGAEAYKQLPKRVIESLWGFSLCFFGGQYPVSLAAVEAFQVTGGNQIIIYLQDFGEQVKHVIHMECEDNLKDEDNDGTPDVLQIKDPKELAKRKLFLLLQAVDPERLSRAIGGLYSGWMGILVALKFKFAETVALAHSIGDQLRPLATKVFAPALLAAIPAEYHKWVNYCLKFGCKAFALVVAWRIQKVISSVQSGLKGGAIMAASLYKLLQEKRLLKADMDHTIIDDVAAFGLAGLGIYFQLVKGGKVPFPFNLFLWPMSIVERVLQWQVTWIPVNNQPRAIKDV